MLVGKPFSVKELVDSLRAENKSQVRTGGAEPDANEVHSLTGRSKHV